MTFSIVARSGEDFGVAVASKFLAAGALVPEAEPGVGAIATQAYGNPSYRPQGMALLRKGRSATETVALLTADDDDRDLRQVGVVGRSGYGATCTGQRCLSWAGGRSGEGYAIQGNILAGENVVAEMERAWFAGHGDRRPLAWRLLEVLEAGDAAGGDRRGRQSAAVVVASQGGGYGGGDIAVDLRVDDHPRPVEELRRLLALHEFYFGAPDPASLVPLDAPLQEEVLGLLASIGQAPARPGTAAISSALAEWASMENLEMRYAGGEDVDPIVLEYLRKKAGGAQK
jgi:uncharacterized Ntn-hydrolase superfamily protein